MKAVVVLQLKVTCEGAPYPMRSRPTKTSPYYVMCSCPGCAEVCRESLERWEKLDVVDVFTVTACNETEAARQGTLLSLWFAGLRQRGATYSPMGVST